MKINFSQNSDLANKEQIKDMAMFGNVNDPGYSQMEELSQLDYEQLNRDDVYLSFSHMVVFQHALEYEELKDLIVEFCHELVEYSIKVNSSNELFFASSAYFGMYILVLLVEKYHEYSYMIGDFIAKDSDYDQMMYHGSSLVTYLFDKYKYEDFMLDLFASCRFEYLYGTMSQLFSDSDAFFPDLFTCFLKDQQKYLSYKNYFLESLKRRPIELDLEDRYGEKRTVVSELFKEMIQYYDDNLSNQFYDNLDEDSDDEYESILENMDDFDFHGKAITEEIKEFEAQAYEVVKNVPLKELYYYKKHIYDDTHTLEDIKDDPFFAPYNEDNEYNTNTEFFLDGFENGEQLLAYIEENKNPEVLDEIEPTNIRKLALEKKLYIYKRFEYYGYTISTLLEKFLVTYQNPDSFYIDDDGEEEQNQKCLRVVDVLIRLLGEKELSSRGLEIIVDDFELCSKKEALKRYSIKKLANDEISKKLYSLINDPAIENLGLIELEEIYEFYKKAPKVFVSMLDNLILRAYEDTPDHILATVPSLNQKEFAKGSQLIAIAYILYQESQNSFMKNKDLDPLWEFYSNNVYKSFYREIADSISYSFQDEYPEKIPSLLQKIEEYVDTQEVDEPKGFFSKFMKSSKEEDKSDKISKEEAIACVKELLFEEEDEDKTSLFVSEDIAMILGSILYAAKVASNSTQKKLLKLYEIILEVFPSKTLFVSFYVFSNSAVYTDETSSKEINNFADILSELGFDEKYSFLIKILMCQEANEYETSIRKFENKYGLQDLYKTLIKIYINKDNIDLNEPAMLVKREKQIAEAITNGVELLDIDNKNKFLEFVASESGDGSALEIIKDKLKIELDDFISLNTGTDNQEKIDEYAKLFNNYIFEDLSIEQLEEELIVKFGDRKELDNLDDICDVLFDANDEVIQKLLVFICRTNKTKNIAVFYDCLCEDYEEDYFHLATEKLHKYTQNANLEGQLIYEFYLKEFKNFDDEFYFVSNPFTKVLKDNLESIQTYEKLLKKKGYKLFIDRLENGD